MKAEDRLKERLIKADKTVKVYSYSSLLSGFIPFPGLDMVAVTGLQKSLINSLSKLYSVNFSKNAVNASVSSLLESVVPQSFRRGILDLFIDSIPVVGTITGISTSLFSASFTYAIGQVYIKHFESGGTVLNFDPVAMRSHFEKSFAAGQEKAKNYRSKLKSKILD
ncbi:MAG: DUF697 domain-containing protein [Candidatus Electryoneaceae bacterium]|nr:DUF697 domain-containing protein [Candidatus Electryoneaceae bacterium]